MNQVIPIRPQLLRSRAVLWLLLATVGLLIGISGYFVFKAWHSEPAPRAGAVTATPDEVAARWGINVTMVGVTADGGMIDFRYRVLDEDKALNMLQDLGTVPVLIAEDSGTLINTASTMSKTHDLHAGQIYFILYHNDGGAIKAGATVSVVIGDLRLEHVAVQ
ncbi:MAG: hypothetical protein R2911_00950 [Caldilineaceae bacterium]